MSRGPSVASPARTIVRTSVHSPRPIQVGEEIDVLARAAGLNQQSHRDVIDRSSSLAIASMCPWMAASRTDINRAVTNRRLRSRCDSKCREIKLFVWPQS